MGKMPCNTPSAENTSPNAPKMSIHANREYTARKEAMQSMHTVFGEHAKSISAYSLSTPRDMKVYISQLTKVGGLQNKFRKLQILKFADLILF
jgi:hypothetical protein